MFTILPAIEISLEQPAVVNDFALLKQVVDNLQLPKGVTVKIEGDKLILNAADYRLGTQIIVPLNQKTIDDLQVQVDEEITNALTG